MSSTALAIPLFSFQPRTTAPLSSAPQVETPLVETPQVEDVADPYVALVEAAKAGDRMATDALIMHLRPLIVRYCRARIGRSVSTFASADDVAQEVCMAVLTALPSYRSSGASFLGFVYGIATHKIMDFHRKYSRDRSTPVAELPETGMQVAGPEQHLLRLELGQQLGALLDELSCTQREVLTLRLIVGLSVAETAEATSMSAGAVRVCQHRALAKLRRQIVELPTMELSS